MRKRHSTDRQRGGLLWTERWTNAKAALVGFLTGRGYSSDAIAAEVGVQPGTIRKMWESWGMSPTDPHSAHLVVPLTILQRAHIAARAAQRGMPIEKYVADMIVHGSMPRDRYADLVPVEKTIAANGRD